MDEKRVIDYTKYKLKKEDELKDILKGIGRIILLWCKKCFTSVVGYHGIALVSEKCAACGECYLEKTGGICPVVNCPKGLLNGLCGGATEDGKCEVNKEQPCVWVLIYEKLKKINKLELLREYQNPRDFKKMEVNIDLRRKVFFDIDKNEEV
ncbi:methylenetetrahydrofolate reductase C-terminal domain-containing protein [bacterium]|nr:methylenetetrahydrofolate reductase C-terminal domain-containing protein [bacterium]